MRVPRSHAEHFTRFNFRRWKGRTEVKYAWEEKNRFPGGVSREDAVTAVANAFNTWSRVIPLKFTRVSPREPHDISVGFSGPGDPWLAPKPNRNKLAYAVYKDNDVDHVRIQFDITDPWFVRKAAKSSYDLQSIALHEIGHAIGLDHSLDPAAVMYESADRGVCRRQLTMDDVKGAQSIYGENTAVHFGGQMENGPDCNPFKPKSPLFRKLDTIAAEIRLLF